MNPRPVLEEVVGHLERVGIPYMLTGSFAASLHGRPRATQDIDLVVAPEGEQVLDLVRGLGDSGYDVSEAAALEAASARGQFNVIERDSGWKVDLIFRKNREFSRVEFGRRRREDALDLSLFVATPEDTIVAKLEWAEFGDSERQIRDVAGILTVQGRRIDEQYVERWVEALGLDRQWQAARRMAAGEEEIGGNENPDTDGLA